MLFADAQSQTISGTLLPKKGESVVYSSKTTDIQKPDVNKQALTQQSTTFNQQDTTAKKAVPKNTTHSTTEKPVVKTKVPAAKAPVPKGFIFNLPVVQSAANAPTTAQQIPSTTPVATEELKSQESSNNNAVGKPVVPVVTPPQQTVANNSTPASTKKAANEPLKYEEPPSNNAVAKPVLPVLATPQQTVANNPTPISPKKIANEPLKYEEPPIGSSGAWSAPPNSTAAAKLEPLVYGPPPVANTTAASGDNNTTDKKASLRSPKFKGVYKPEPKKPILMAPMSPDDMEDGVPKKKETEPTANVVEKRKAVEDLYPPLNYTAPVPATVSNLRSPKIQGAYVASKNNPMILMPVPPEPTSGQQQNGSTLVYQEPPVQTYNNNKNGSRTEQSASGQPNIFDENYKGKPAAANKPVYSKYKKVAPKTTIKRGITKPITTSANPVTAPVKQPVKNNFKKTFLKPVRQSVNSGVSFNYQPFNIPITQLALAAC